MTNNLKPLLHTKNAQNYYNEKTIESTYNVNTHCDLLYALKVWNYVNFIRKVRLTFLLKLFFIKVGCLINVNKILGLFRNG